MNTPSIIPNGAKQEKLVLGGVEVHLWTARLDGTDESTLSPDEVARANRYLSPLVRQRFIACRATLRAILAAYLNVHPRSVEFQVASRGKPGLGPHHPLRFNLSHSEDLLVVALTWGHEIGVDVEYIRPVPEADIIAAQYFSSAEVDQYRRLPPDIKQQAFFNCWTRKEAYIKASGEGLAIPLSSFEVSFLPGEPPALHCPVDAQIYAFSPAPAYTGALVVLGC